MNVSGHKIVSEDEIKKSGGIIYDVNDGEGPLNLPNASDVMDDIIKILECMNTDEMKLLKATNAQVFEQTMEDKFPLFTFTYYSIFKMLLSGEDIEPLKEMLKIINTVNQGQQSAEDGEKDVGKYLSKFLPENLLEKLDKPPKSSQGKKKKNKH